MKLQIVFVMLFAFAVCAESECIDDNQQLHHLTEVWVK